MKKIIRSNQIYDSVKEPFKGFIQIEDGKITNVQQGWDYEEFLDSNTELVIHDEEFIMYGIHDNHVFFTGYLSMNAGIDFSMISDFESALDLIRCEIGRLTDQTTPVYGHGWCRELVKMPTEDDLNHLNHFGPITVISQDRSYCSMNSQAKERYGFTEEECSAEDRVFLLKEMLSNKELVNQVYKKFENLLLSRGVVSIKEIIFDDCNYLNDLDSRTIRTNFYIQPVEKSLDFSLLKAYKEAKFPPKVKFGGSKLMVDGVVASQTADVKGTYYSGTDKPMIDYPVISELVSRLSSAGIPCCLTAEGDKAIEESATILSSNQKINTVGYNSISDLEMITNEAARQMHEKEIVAEIYPQILGLNASIKEGYMDKVIVDQAGEDFFNYKCLVDNNVLLTSGTDLPLFITDVPDSLVRANYRKFAKTNEQWFLDKGISTDDLLKSWTVNGYRANRLEEYGTIESGKNACLAVFNKNLCTASEAELSDAEIVATYVDGECVYKKI